MSDTYAVDEQKAKAILAGDPQVWRDSIAYVTRSISTWKNNHNIDWESIVLEAIYKAARTYLPKRKFLYHAGHIARNMLSSECRHRRVRSNIEIRQTSDVYFVVDETSDMLDQLIAKQDAEMLLKSDPNTHVMTQLIMAGNSRAQAARIMQINYFKCHEIISKMRRLLRGHNMLVIGRGPSVNEYARNELKQAAKDNFTFCVNDAAFDFACDVIVALDPEWIKTHRDKLKKMNKPIITREWDCLKGLGLDLIELPNNIVEFARLSGMAAAKISDSMANRLGMYSFVVGLDHTKLHYDRMETTCQPIPSICDIDAYKRLECHNTINLGEHSEITCWTKSVYLPTADKPDAQARLWGILALKMSAKDWIRENIK